MTAEANKTPLSVDYTGRDYYAIREQLIERVQERVPDWQGNDANDFGLALIEAFSYMGDLVNYYIDRVANETYILTATQRESLLNIASMYGYKPTNYVSASAILNITSRQGYQGQIGGAILENGTIDSVSKNGYCKVIVPNDHVFSVDGEFDYIKVTSVPATASGIIGDTTVSYFPSVFNGTFKVANVGYDNYGKNVIWYRPVGTVTNVEVMQTTVTSASGNGTTTTYYCDNQFVVGQTVLVSGLTTTTGASLNLETATEVASATSTYFTVESSTVGTSAGTGLAIDATNTRFVITLDEETRTISPLSDQRISLSGVVVGSGENNYNGKWSVESSVPATETEDMQIIVKTDVAYAVPEITYAKVSGGTYQYSIWNDDSFAQGLTAGQIVTITGVKSSANTGGTAATAYNLEEVEVLAVKDIEAAVSHGEVTVNGSDYDYTYYTSEQFSVGDIVTMRNIGSTLTSGGAADVGFNLTNKTVSSVTATKTASITLVTGDVNGNGTIYFETDTSPDGHGFQVGDYVTMTGIVNETDDLVSQTDVYNMKAAKILSVSGGTESGKETNFTVRGYWTSAWDAALSESAVATLYAFTIEHAGPTDTFKAAGAAISKYFTVTQSGTPGTWNASTDAKVTPQIGGTYASGGELIYSDIPVLILSGPTATSLGSTVVPAGTQVSTQVTVDGAVKDVIFSTQSDMAIPYRSTESVLALHGEDISLRTDNLKDTTAKPYDINGELLGYSSGKADQTFALKEVQASPRSVRIFIDNGVEWEEWTQVEHIQDYAPSSKVFEISVAASEEIRVLFGDGISGEIPTKESGIKAVYIAGGGTVGNVSAGTLTTWNSIQGVDADAIRNNMSVTNPAAATGGANPETNDSIRYNAPKALRALNRAVTLEDFASLALAVDGVVKANAVAESRGSVTVYIAPSSTEGSGEESPGVDQDGGPTPQMDTYKQLVAEYLADKTQIGTTVTVIEPTYSKVHVDVQYSSLPQYNPATVGTAIKKEIVTAFSYNNSDFEDVITPEEVEFKLRQVDGVSNVRVTGLYRLGGSGRNSLLGDPYELFVFSDAEISPSATSSEARANTIVFTPYHGGTSLAAPVLTPSINGEVYSYNLTLPATTDKVVVNVGTLQADGKASVAVNDVFATYDSGTSTYEMTFDDNDSALANTPNVPATTIIVTVTAEDGITVKSYKFKVTISS